MTRMIVPQAADLTCIATSTAQSVALRYITCAKDLWYIPQKSGATGASDMSLTTVPPLLRGATSHLGRPRSSAFHRDPNAVPQSPERQVG